MSYRRSSLHKSICFIKAKATILTQKQSPLLLYPLDVNKFHQGYAYMCNFANSLFPNVKIRGLKPKAE